MSLHASHYVVLRHPQILKRKVKCVKLSMSAQLLHSHPELFPMGLTKVEKLYWSKVIRRFRILQTSFLEHLRQIVSFFMEVVKLLLPIAYSFV